jgi:SNF2 family DNA or RNA helicase
MLVVCPATVLQHWLAEFHHWAPRLRVVLLHAISDSFSQLQDLGPRGIYRALNKIAKARAATGVGDEEEEEEEEDGSSGSGSGDDNVDVHSGIVCVTTYEGLRRLAPKVQVHRVNHLLSCAHLK